MRRKLSLSGGLGLMLVCVTATVFAAPSTAAPPTRHHGSSAGARAHGTRNRGRDRKPALTSRTAGTHGGTTTTTTELARPPAAVAETFVSTTTGLPSAGEATMPGCTAALAYLDAYAAPGFQLVCPGDAGGHQATTMCASLHAPCDVQRVITIADPCPAAYMNEAANSWVLLGLSDDPIDPYGACP